MELDEWDNFTREEREEIEQFEASCREEPYEVTVKVKKQINGIKFVVTRILERRTCKIIGEKREKIKDE